MVPVIQPITLSLLIKYYFKHPKNSIDWAWDVFLSKKTFFNNEKHSNNYSSYFHTQFLELY